MLNCIFATYTFSITLGLDTYESTSFKLGIMPHSAKPYMFYTSLKDLDLFIQGHRDTRKLELVQSFCWREA